MYILHVQFSLFYVGGLVIILTGLVMYNVIVAPEGGTDQSVFSIGYWYNYGHSLFCEWRCCPPKYKTVELSDNDNNSVSDNIFTNHDQLPSNKLDDLTSGNVDDQSMTKDDQRFETHPFITYDNAMPNSH